MRLTYLIYFTGTLERVTFPVAISYIHIYQITSQNTSVKKTKLSTMKFKSPNKFESDITKFIATLNI